ncbi:MAG TPA: hypothetical protein VGN38_02005 [Caulobacteraceae bacterium]|jgi:hypothetical protein|nr:hypothetical protein [Caulobacteraceae bacterium]
MPAKLLKTRHLWKCLVVALVAPISLLTATAQPHDPRAPFTVYEGRWRMIFSDGHTLELTNLCHRFAKAFACEQLVDGKPVDLVIYAPAGEALTPKSYRSVAVPYGGASPGPWNSLTIDGPRWIYQSSKIEDGHTTYHRTLNDFEGRDNIRFTQQQSRDGMGWQTVASGEEVRVK